METDFDKYQKLASSTIIYPKDIAIFYLLIGLSNEVGELLGLFKKLYRDNNGVLTDNIKDKAIKEMGDVLWYLSVLAKELGILFSVVANKNIEKLQDRKNRGMLNGSGDDR